MRQRKMYRNEKLPVIELMEGNELWDCWLADYKYLRVGDIVLCREWAIGEGDIVRHLCGDNRCVNPVHLKMGTDFENADDEIEVRDFTTAKFMEMMNDYSLKDEPKDRAFLVTIPRMSRKLTEDSFKRYKLSETIKYGRELFRKDFVFRLTTMMEENEEVRVSWTKILNERLSWLKSKFYAVKVYTNRYR